MRQTDGVISEAIYYDVVRTSSASTYEADAVIVSMVQRFLKASFKRLFEHN